MGQRFSEAFLQDLRARTRLVDLIGRDVKLTRRGKEHEALCPFHAEKTPSFTVVEAKGFYHCFGCGAHGDAIQYLQHSRGLSFVEAVAELAAEAGLGPFDWDRVRREGVRPKPPVLRETPEEHARAREKRIAWAREIWSRCTPGAGTLVETYLRSRGITLPVPPTLRYHRALKHKDTGQHFPAMVAAIQDREGRVVGVHRTFLRLDGQGKAQVRKAKMVLGAKRGCAIRLAAAAPRMVTGEGIETTQSLMQATGLPGWAAIDLENFAGAAAGQGRSHPDKNGQRLPSEIPDMEDAGFVPPPACEELIFGQDADSKDPPAAEALVRRGLTRLVWNGITCRAPRPPEGMDFNDMLRGDAA